MLLPQLFILESSFPEGCHASAALNPQLPQLCHESGYGAMGVQQGVGEMPGSIEAGFLFPVEVLGASGRLVPDPRVVSAVRVRTS